MGPTTAESKLTDQADDDVYCECGAALTDAEIDSSGYQCTRCHAGSHFTCADCGEDLDNEERSSKCKTRCQTCQEAKDEEELEARKESLRDEARELLESLCDDGDVTALRKAVAALKRLQPT